MNKGNDVHSVSQTNGGGMLDVNAKRIAAQMQAIGIECRGIAIFDSQDAPIVCLSEAPDEAVTAAAQLASRARHEKQISIVRVGTAGVLVGHPLSDGPQPWVAVAWIAGGISDRVVSVFQLSLAWLQLPLLQSEVQKSREAEFLLEMQAHVFSQEKARSAAQEWINRLAQYMRANTDSAACTLSYFRVERDRPVHPRWWVTSDTAWAERGAPELHAATDLATRATVECREIRGQEDWTFPVLDQGDVVGVIVANGINGDAPTLHMVRASASVVAPLLGWWHLGERGVLAHAVASSRDVIRKITAPGFLTWKIGAAATLLLSGLIILVPFDDRAIAKVVVEGQQQQLVTAPFEGYWDEVLVRPGDVVRRGQVLARLDKRDLLVEQEKLLSERDQASGKLRNAFAERDSAAVQMASAQLKQAEAQLALVQTRLQRADIVAPVDGTLIFGDWRDQLRSPVETGKKIFEIAAGSGYRVVLQMPEEDIARVSVGQVGSIRVTGMPQKEFGFRVNRITSVAAVEESKNTFRVEAVLADSDAPLRPGMQGVGKVVVGRSNLLTIWTRPFSQWLRMKIWSMWW